MLIHYKSKTWAAWLALLGGTLGLHRFYLRGFRDAVAWLHVVPTALGWLGIRRMQLLGQDDRAAWLLIPLLGLMVAQACLLAILYGLTPDEKWDALRNPGTSGRNTRWGPVLAAMAALLIGAGAAMATVAFGMQRLFESLQEP